MGSGTGISLGIDVGEHRSWCVAMDRSRTILGSDGPIDPEDLLAIIRHHRPAIVAIDAPRNWAREGNSRQCERVLHGQGIRCFFTPVEARTRGKKFYGWVRTGIRFYEEAARARCSTIEVFPHAAEVELLSSWRVQKSKVRRRRSLLKALGVAPSDIEKHCSNIHRTDAAVCALVGFLYLEGRTTEVGTTNEGKITVPS